VVGQLQVISSFTINPLNAELNPICHLLALLGGATIVVVSKLRVNNNNKEKTYTLDRVLLRGTVY
jgi:hypothetical protein